MYEKLHLAGVFFPDGKVKFSMENLVRDEYCSVFSEGLG
jgi:hypothetical protein